LELNFTGGNESPGTHRLEEEVQLGVGVRVHSDLKQGREYVVQQLLKVVYQALRFIDVIQARNLRIAYMNVISGQVR
jgi:hypothetical protein